MELSNKSDLHLIELIKNKSDSAAFLELQKRVEKSYYRTCKSYCRRVPMLSYESLVEDVHYVMQKAIISYKPNKKTKFNTWLTNMGRFHILNTIKSSTENGHFIPSENKDIDIINNSNNIFFEEKREDLKEHIFYILDRLADKRIVNIFKLRFYSDKKNRKWKSIAGKMDLSIQQTMSLFNKGRDFLYKKLTVEHNQIRNNP